MKRRFMTGSWYTVVKMARSTVGLADGGGMKHCNRCDRTLEDSAFAKKRRGEKVGLQPWCRECSKLYHRERYQRDAEWRARVRRQAKERGDRTRAFVNDYLAKHPCVDCGEADPVVLEFDHVRGKKSFNIGTEANRRGEAALAKEIAKCEVRCANCHRRVTAKRKNGGVV